MRTNNEQNNIEKTPQKQRSVENRRFTESPKALRRSFRRVRQRGGSVHFSKIKSEEEGKRIVRPNSLNLKLNGNCGDGRNYLIKNERENIDEEQKIEKGIDIKKIKNGEEIVESLKENDSKEEDGEESKNVTDFAFQLQQKMTSVLRHQYGNGRKLHVLFVDSPDICNLRKEKFDNNENQGKYQRRKWSSERLPSKSLLKNRRLSNSKNEEKEENNFLKRKNDLKTNNSLINQKVFFERKYFDLTKRHSNASTGSGNGIIYGNNRHKEKARATKVVEKIEKNEFTEANDEKLNIKRRFWSLRNKKRKFSNNINCDIINCGKKLSNSCETVGTRLALFEQGCEQDRLTGEWVQVQILHLPNEPEGLGFGIVGGHSTGVVIKSIVAGSVADKDQRLRPGDRILQIGHISTQGLNSQQIAALLRQQDGPYVQMTVAHSIQLQDTETTDTPSKKNFFLNFFTKMEVKFLIKKKFNCVSW
ncbi:unnamed protein product [Meloidogyne enterolobii]|uniref:Uncharacterized protein n=1 Tax=Meloidogyne enterolobii TaxID=390850 RepID=A0ACB1AMZ5_MELEN